ncbi:MAG: Ig-like domain-containing protein [Ruminococcus sp.]
MSKCGKQIVSLLIAFLLIFGSAFSISAAEINEYDVGAETVNNVIKLDVNSGEDISQPLQDALYKARSLATSTSPYKIVIPEGTYYLRHVLFMYSNTVISAYGAHIIKDFSSGCMLQSGHLTADTAGGAQGYNGFENITLEGGIWDGNCFDDSTGGANTFCNLRFGHIKNLKIENVTVSNNNGSHHIEIGGAKNVEINGCTFTGYRNNTKEAIQLDVIHSEALFNSFPKYDDSTCEDVYIHDNVFENVPRAVGSHNAVVGRYHNNINFYNNVCSGMKDKAIVCYNWTNSKIYSNKLINVGAGIDFKFMDGDNYYPSSPDAESKKAVEESNSEIRDNTITVKNYQDSQTPTSYGIRIGGGEVTSSNNRNKISNGIYRIKNVVVKNNNISGSSKFPLRLEYANKCTISGNTVDSSLNDGALVNARSISLMNSCENTVTNNTFKNLPNSDANSIQIESASNSNTFSGNTVSNIGKAGISINGSNKNTISGGSVTKCKNIGVTISNGSSGNTVSGVTISDCSENGISVNKSDNTKITGCTIKNNAKRGINVTSSKSVSVSDNKISACKDLGISLNTASSATVLKNNILTSNGGSNAITVNSDSSAPAASLKNTVLSAASTSSNSISGSAQKSLTVSVMNGSQILGSSQVSSDGSFKVTFTKPSLNVNLTVAAKDSNGNLACDTFLYRATGVASVAVSNTSLTLGVGETYKLKASVSPSGADQSCTWSSSNSSVVSVDGSGKVTAKKTGTASITVKTYNGKTAQCKVTVKPAPTSVKTNPTSVTLGVGESYTISENTNSGTYANAANLNWTSTNTSVATVTKGSSNKATITAKGAGTAYVKITLYNGLTAQCKVTVKSAPTSVITNPTSVTLGVGESYTISENTNSGSYANAASIIWSSSNAGVATVTKGSANKATIKAKGPGTAYIKVTLYNGKTAQCKVTVKTAPSSVKTNPTSVTLGAGESYTISESTNSGTYANAENLKWTSSDSSVATVSKGSANKATITAKGAGTAYIKITLYNGLTAQCKVTVKPAPTSVKVNPSSVTLGVGESYTISESTNSGSYANAANLKWTSSDSNVVTVSKGSANKATITAKGAGTAYIKITLYNGKTAQCNVTVKEDPYVKKVLEIANNERVKAGRKPLSLRTDMTELANIRVKEIVEKFSHERPDGTTVFNLAREKGIVYGSMAENIAKGQGTPESVVNAWFGSQVHKDNVLSSSYTGAGIAHYKQNDIDYWVMVLVG